MIRLILIAAASLGVEVVTLELPDVSRESILRNMAPVLHDVLSGVAPV